MLNNMKYNIEAFIWYLEKESYYAIRKLAYPRILSKDQIYGQGFYGADIEQYLRNGREGRSQ